MDYSFRLDDVEGTKDLPEVLAAQTIQSESLDDTSSCNSHRYCDCQNKQGGENTCNTYQRPSCRRFECDCEDYCFDHFDHCGRN